MSKTWKEMKSASDLGYARDLAARNAAAALSMLVQKGVVTTPSVVKLARDWDFAHNVLQTEVARRWAVRAIENACESSRGGTK